MNLSFPNTRVARAVALAAACGALLFSTKAAGQIVLQPGPDGYDTWLEGASANSNFGSGETALIGSYLGVNNCLPLFQFDLSSVPSTYALDSATLTLTEHWTGDAHQYRVHVMRVTEPWSEAQATWNNRLTGVAWSTPGGGTLVDTGLYTEFICQSGYEPVTFDLTALVNGWLKGTYPNYGLLLMPEVLALGGGGPENNYTNLYTSDSSNAAYRPKLTLNGSMLTPTTFSYQGRLNRVGAPASGAFDFQFALYAAPTGGDPIGSALSLLGQTVTDGYFTAMLDFGDAFDGSGRWIEVQVRAAGGGSYTTLSPRQPVTATPYAIRAHTATTALALAGGTSATVPSGAIVMWSGALGSIPNGWHLCDGSAGTPDLRDRFVMGTRDGEAPGETGGANQLTLNWQQMPSHNHGISILNSGSHEHSYVQPANFALFDNAGWLQGQALNGTNWASTNGGGEHTHDAYIGWSGGNQPFDNRPAYYRLAYIMKL